MLQKLLNLEIYLKKFQRSKFKNEIIVWSCKSLIHRSFHLRGFVYVLKEIVADSSVRNKRIMVEKLESLYYHQRMVGKSLLPSKDGNKQPRTKRQNTKWNTIISKLYQSCAPKQNWQNIYRIKDVMAIALDQAILFYWPDQVF